MTLNLTEPLRYTAITTKHKNSPNTYDVYCFYDYKKYLDLPEEIQNEKTKEQYDAWWKWFTQHSN